MSSTNGTATVPATATVFTSLGYFKNLWGTNYSHGGEHLSFNPDWDDSMVNFYLALYQDLKALEEAGHPYEYAGLGFYARIGNQGQIYIIRQPICSAKIDPDFKAEAIAKAKASRELRREYRQRNQENNGGGFKPPADDNENETI